MDWLHLLWLLLFLPLSILFAISTAFQRVLRGQASRDVRMDVLGAAEFEAAAARTVACEQWAEAKGWEWLGAWALTVPRVPPNLIIAWKRPGHGDYLACYLLPKAAAIDLVSHYEGGHALDTSGHGYGRILPTPPGKARQVFTGLSIGELWERHVQADQFLRREFRWRPEDVQRDFESHFLESVCGDAQFIMSIPGWQVRCIFWYLTHWFRRNQPITAQRHDRDAMMMRAAPEPAHA